MALDTTLIAMIEPISTTPQDPAPPLMTDDTAQGAARLSELMSVQESPATGDVVEATAPAGASTSHGTLGDAILGKMENVRQRFEAVVVDAHDAIEKMNAPSVQDLLAVQFKLLTASLEVEVISKGVGKAVQHVDQLTKLQ